MPNTILITVIAKDGISLIGCPTKVHLPCPANTVIDGRDFYFQSDDLQQTWKFPPLLTAAVLPAVGFPTAYIKSNGHDYYAIANQDESPAEPINEVIAELCNVCCETSPGGEPEAIATVANIIPALQHMAAGDSDQNCSTGVCTYNYYDALPADGSPYHYNLTFACGGVVYTSGSTKFTTIAAALAWAVANWGALGTWTLSGTRLRVAGATCAVGNLYHTNY